MNNGKPLVKNAANETEVREAEVKAKLAEDQRANDLRYMLASDQGKRFIWALLESCGIFKSSFTGSSETYFLEGQRNIGLKLLAEIMKTDPEAYVKMYKLSKKD